MYKRRVSWLRVVATISLGFTYHFHTAGTSISTFAKDSGEFEDVSYLEKGLEPSAGAGGWLFFWLPVAWSSRDFIHVL